MKLPSMTAQASLEPAQQHYVNHAPVILRGSGIIGAASYELKKKAPEKKAQKEWQKQKALEEKAKEKWQKWLKEQYEPQKDDLELDLKLQEERKERALELTKEFYGGFPGPETTLYDKAKKISIELTNLGIDTIGVIAVATSNIANDELYFGMSPDIQLAVKKAHLNLDPILRRILGRYQICKYVSDEIADEVAYNKGCAEKKIITKMLENKGEIREISVVPHPDDAWGQGISDAQLVVATADNVYIAPCKTCIQIYQKYFGSGN